MVINLIFSFDSSLVGLMNWNIMCIWSKQTLRSVFELKLHVIYLCYMLVWLSPGVRLGIELWVQMVRTRLGSKMNQTRPVAICRSSGSMRHARYNHGLNFAVWIYQFLCCVYFLIRFICFAFVLFVSNQLTFHVYNTYIIL